MTNTSFSANFSVSTPTEGAFLDIRLGGTVIGRIPLSNATGSFDFGLPVTNTTGFLFFTVSGPAGFTLPSVTLGNFFLNGRPVADVTVQAGAIQSVGLTGLVDDGERRVVNGTEGADRLFGATGNDSVQGLGGDDRIFTYAGHDFIDAGEGSDRVFASDGDDVVRGGGGNDFLYGETGNDTVYGGTGDDIIYLNDGADAGFGDEGVDRLYGGAGNDLMDGGADQDYLYGDDGEDTLYGGGGDDFVYGGLGYDVIDGGDGSDRLYGNEGYDQINGGAGDDFLYGGEGNDILDGGAGNDVVYGNEGHNVISGGAGDDRLFGDIGCDVVSGGDGADTIYGNGENDVLHGNAGEDRVFGGDGVDVITGGDGIDRLYGDAGNDSLAGDAGDDFLYGGDGIDVLDGGAGRDRLFGNEHNDTLIGGEGNDILVDDRGANRFDGGAGNDLIDARDQARLGVVSVADQVAAILAANPGVVYNETSGNFYRFMQTQTTWFTANDAARASLLNGQSGYLATVESRIENSFLDTISGTHQIWLGGSDAAAEGTWVWGNGSATVFWQGDRNGSAPEGIYENFSNDEPNNVGRNGEDYLQMYNGGRWNDLDGTGRLAYVIEWTGASLIDPGPDALPVFDQIIDGGAGNDTIYSGAGSDRVDAGAGNDVIISGTAGGVSVADVLASNPSIVYDAASDRFYQFVSTGMNFNDATDHAHWTVLFGANGMMATAETQAINQLLDQISGNASIWLNGTDAVTEGTWVWGNGLDTVFWQGDRNGAAPSGAYANFNRGEPNNVGSSGEDFLQMYNGGRWNDLNGTSNLTFVIQWDADDVLVNYGHATIRGGAGSDTITLSGGIETLVYRDGDIATGSVDTVNGFNAARDRIDLSDILDGFDPATESISDFIQITSTATGSALSVNADGSGFVTVANFAGTNLGSVDDLVDRGTIVV